MYERDELFIDGKWTAPESDSVISVISPHSEAVIGHAASRRTRRCESGRRGRPGSFRHRAVAAYATR